MERTLSTLTTGACHAHKRSPYELDSLEVMQLLTLRDAGHNRTAVWVGNLLCAAYGHCTPPLTGGDGQPKARRRPYAPLAEMPRAAHLLIAPNPASGLATFTYLLKQAPQDAWLRITDLSGRVMHQARIAQNEGSLSWDFQSLAAGVYAVSVTEKGRVELSEKLVIQP